jgi:hypothetical protein
MRPTDLKFRSPKEKTEYTDNVMVTNDGKKLFNDSFINSSKHSPINKRHQ